MKTTPASGRGYRMRRTACGWLRCPPGTSCRREHAWFPARSRQLLRLGSCRTCWICAAQRFCYDAGSWSASVLVLRVPRESLFVCSAPSWVPPSSRRRPPRTPGHRPVYPHTRQRLPRSLDGESGSRRASPRCVFRLDQGWPASPVPMVQRWPSRLGRWTPMASSAARSAHGFPTPWFTVATTCTGSPLRRGMRSIRSLCGRSDAKEKSGSMPVRRATASSRHPPPPARIT